MLWTTSGILLSSSSCWSTTRICHAWTWESRNSPSNSASFTVIFQSALFLLLFSITRLKLLSCSTIILTLCCWRNLAFRRLISPFSVLTLFTLSSTLSICLSIHLSPWTFPRKPQFIFLKFLNYGTAPQIAVRWSSFSKYHHHYILINKIS